MRAVSLFSGVGGFELGFDRAGIETVLQAERDPWCQQVLARHWPHVERVSDVASVSAEQLHIANVGADERSDHATRDGADDLSGHVDLVFGGFPCQPFSVAGKRAGAADERDGWPEFRRVLRELRPAYVVAENVPGLLSVARGRYFGAILNDLVELGYGVAWAVRDAQFFGVPQRRRRVFVVGTLDADGRAGAERSAQVLSLCESCGGNPETGRAPGQELAYALAASARGTGDGHGNAWNSTYVAPAIPASGRGFARTGESRGQDPLIVANAGTASAGHHGHSSPRGDGSDNLIAAPELAYALAARNAKGVSLLESQDTFVVPPAGVRRLTPRECERLQGWPDDHTRWAADGREIADSHRYRMVGNGVASPVAEWIGRRLVAVDAGGE